MRYLIIFLISFSVFANFKDLETVEEFHVSTNTKIIVKLDEKIVDGKLFCASKFFIQKDEQSPSLISEAELVKSYSLDFNVNTVESCQKIAKGKDLKLASIDDYINHQKQNRLPASSSNIKYCYHDSYGFKGACFKSLSVCMAATANRDRVCGVHKL